MTSKLGTCATCSLLPAIYTCPACQLHSCSLNCINDHKLKHACTGIAPPQWSLPIRAGDWNWGTVMRDQSYLSQVGREVEQVGRKLVGEELVPTAQSAREEEGDEEGGGGRLDERTEKEERLVKEARKEGVVLILLPKGMSRRTRNASRWDHKYVLPTLSSPLCYPTDSLGTVEKNDWNGPQKYSFPHPHHPLSRPQRRSTSPRAPPPPPSFPS